MDHFEVKVGEVNEPVCLLMIKRLGLADVGEILVISEKLNRKRGTMKAMSPRFQGMDNGKEFAVIDVIVPLRGRE